MSVRFIEAHITGSSLVRGVVPNDTDIMVLFEDRAHMEDFLYDKDQCGTDEYTTDGSWAACRVGNKNYICTINPEFYYRMKAYSTALKYLQLEDKAARVCLCRACRDHDPEYVYEI